MNAIQQFFAQQGGKLSHYSAARNVIARARTQFQAPIRDDLRTMRRYVLECRNEPLSPLPRRNPPPDPRLQAVADGALAQISEEEFFRELDPESNSIAIV